MSHFSKLNVMVKKSAIANDVCKRLGYTKEHADVYENPWKYANESIKDCMLYKKDGQVKFVVDNKGNVVHDSWSMGTDVDEFLREYSTEYIRRTAAADGAIVRNKGVDADGQIVLEVEYGF